MKLTFFKPKGKIKSKITLHKTGKLGFSKGAETDLDLSKNPFIKIGTDHNENIFVKSYQEKDHECFPVSKAGSYYYIYSLSLLQDLRLNKDDSVIFDLSVSKDGYFLMQKRK